MITIYSCSVIYLKENNIERQNYLFEGKSIEEQTKILLEKDKMFEVRLFNLFISSTVVLYFCAILYRESPLFTV